MAYPPRVTLRYSSNRNILVINISECRNETVNYLREIGNLKWFAENYANKESLSLDNDIF